MLESVKDLIMQYGYPALYGLLTLGIVGLPVPDEFLMTFVGYLTSIGWFSFPVSLAVSFAGAMSGMLLSYVVGHRVGKPFLRRYGKWVKLTPERLEKAEGWFDKYGMWTVTFGYFVPGVRHFTCYLAGMTGVRFWKYLLFSSSGAFVWCATFLTLGHVVGNSMDEVLPIMHRYMGIGALGLLAIAGLTVFLVFKYRKRAAS